jgi:hypothetical protein
MKPALLLVVAGVCGVCWWALLSNPLWFVFAVLGSTAAVEVWAIAMATAMLVRDLLAKRRAKQDCPMARVEDWGN